MKTETAFVGAQSGIELDSIAPVDLDLVLVVFPDNAELDDSFGDGGDLEGFPVVGVLLEKRGVLESGDELCYLVSIGFGEAQDCVAVDRGMSRA